MEVSKISQNQSFTSRNSVVRDADWVMRKAKSEFPHFSTTYARMNYSDILDKNYKLNEYLVNKTDYLKLERVLSLGSGTQFKRLKAIISALCDDRLGNCYEDATLADLILKMNGVKNSYRARFLTNHGTKKIDHTVTIIDKNPIDKYFNPKKIIIIDPWLGIADYADRVFKLYKTRYNNFFRMANSQQFDLQMKSQLQLTESELNYFRKEYPQFLYKSNGNHKLMSDF